MKRKYLTLALLILLYIPIFNAEGMGKIFNVSFFAMIVLTWFAANDWKEKDWGSIAIIIFGLFTLNGYITIGIWFNPELYALFIYSIVTGGLLGLLSARDISMKKAGKRIEDALPSVETLDKLFTGK